MASEESSKPSSLPPYPEMIFAALDALNEKDGCNKSSISNYIESNHGGLPADHLTLLSHHLNELKESGELVFVKNNYMKPDPSAPAKRGRGRPPKPKVPLPPGAVNAPARPRGRPRKDPNAPPAQKKARPAATSSAPTVSKTGRPRGRPRKVKPEMAQTGVEAS
ncbi:hypothetical protein F0562_005398 [Nyssa sinensis]|uniref:H15 domain-containing protein n=1 Tax=Nyssa sinensis TaxID=561372 RepID=A0A5J5AKC0_9ASTE|nr:hypothetical protein F0562_005398 [Nyssa sinensis]